MPSPIDITNIPAPRVDFIDPRTGLMAREWYRFFFNLFNLTGGGANDTSLSDLQVGPPSINNVLGEINASFDQSQLAAMSDQAETILGQLGLVYDQAQLASMIAQYEQATLNLQNQFDTAPAAPQLGTIAAYNLDGSPTAGGVGYGTGSAVAFTPAGTSGQFLTSAAAGTPTWSSPSSVAVTSFSAGITGLTPATATTGAVTLAGTLAVANGGTGVTSSTGSGSVVLSTSPTLVTPLLGTPTSGDFSIGTFTWPTFNQNTTGSAAKWTTARNLAGNSVDGSANVAFANKFVVQGTTDTGLSGAQFLGALGTGIVKNTTTTGVLSIAVAADFPTLNQNTTGTAANVTGVVAVANGGTAASTASITSFNNITGYTSTGATGTTSTNLVFSGSPTIATPTFTTSATFPLHIGGTGTTSTLSLRSTSGVGTTGADIVFQTGNNGATEAMRISNAGNVGVGIAPSAWGTNWIGFQVRQGAVWCDASARTFWSNNLYFDGTNRKYILTGVAHEFVMDSNGAYFWKQAASGTAGANITFTQSMTLDASGNLLITGGGSLGYGTGSGGAVTQTTSRTTGVTLDKANGAITLFSAVGTATWQTFTVTNSKVAATDTIIVNQKSGTDLYQIFVTAVAAGSFKITFATTGGTTTEQPVFNFAVIKAVTA